MSPQLLFTHTAMNFLVAFFLFVPSSWRFFWRFFTLVRRNRSCEAAGYLLRSDKTKNVLLGHSPPLEKQHEERAAAHFSTVACGGRAYAAGVARRSRRLHTHRSYLTRWLELLHKCDAAERKVRPLCLALHSIVTRNARRRWQVANYDTQLCNLHWKMFGFSISRTFYFKNKAEKEQFSISDMQLIEFV